jgi:hypothetical protein
MSDYKAYKRPPPLDTNNFQGWVARVEIIFSFYEWTPYLKPEQASSQPEVSTNDPATLSSSDIGKSVLDPEQAK